MISQVPVRASFRERASLPLLFDDLLGELPVSLRNDEEVHSVLLRTDIDAVAVPAVKVVEQFLIDLSSGLIQYHHTCIRVLQ